MSTTHDIEEDTYDSLPSDHLASKCNNITQTIRWKVDEKRRTTLIVLKEIGLRTQSVVEFALWKSNGESRVRFMAPERITIKDVLKIVVVTGLV